MTHTETGRVPWVGGERTAVLGAGFFSEHRLCFGGRHASSDGFQPSVFFRKHSSGNHKLSGFRIKSDLETWGFGRACWAVGAFFFSRASLPRVCATFFVCDVFGSRFKFCGSGRVANSGSRSKFWSRSNLKLSGCVQNSAKFNARRYLPGRNSKDAILNQLRDAAWRSCQGAGVSLQPVWIPEDLYAFTDGLSKLRLGEPWVIAPDWCDVLMAAAVDAYGWRCMVDRFASSYDAKLLFLASMLLQPGYSQYGSTELPWRFLANFVLGSVGIWMFPPIALLTRLISLLLGRSDLVGFPQ